MQTASTDGILLNSPDQKWMGNICPLQKVLPESGAVRAYVGNGENSILENAKEKLFFSSICYFCSEGEKKTVKKADRSSV